ncbi:MAG: signal recognition particle-docking protein FtsY [candidate division KSB1 bacterium]|nr:signal recognition particle-docking protein FtsY [candidate division KSB1 bacterium]
MFSKLKNGLSKTRETLVGKLSRIISSRKKIDEELLEEIEDTLIGGDLGVTTTVRLLDTLKENVRKGGYQNPEELLSLLKREMERLLSTDGDQETISRDEEFFNPKVKPFVIMVVGVNGTGKTTAIGKLAYRFRKNGKKVLVAAADTFRAAAGEQLEIWADRAGADIVRNQPGADPAAVAYDSLKAALARDMDVLIVDTAGRLHTKVNLMEELKKIRRVLTKQMESAPHEVLLVLDATTGQNGLNQTRLFTEAVGVTGLILTKLDGTAKGGILFSIREELKIPVKFVGVGETIEDLEPFNAKEFVEALFQ